MTQSPWWRDYDRSAVRGSIEEATGESLSVDDPLPDTLIAHAQELGIRPVDLRLWIYDTPHPEWTAAALARWARTLGLAREAEP